MKEEMNGRDGEAYTYTFKSQQRAGGLAALCAAAPDFNFVACEVSITLGGSEQVNKLT